MNRRLKRNLLIYAAILLYTVGPLLCVLLSSALAAHYGCKVDESGAHPCLVGGRDIGGTLVALFVTGWLMLVTIPTGLLAFVGFTIFVIATHKSKPTPKNAVEK